MNDNFKCMNCNIDYNIQTEIYNGFCSTECYINYYNKDKECLNQDKKDEK